MDNSRKYKNIKEVKALYNRPLLELVFEAAKIHTQYHTPFEIKAGRLISVKTGNCVENCSYCAQSSRYNTAVDNPIMLSKEEVVVLAQKAKDDGLDKVCLSASYKKMPDGAAFDNILELISTVRNMDMNVCLTMGTVSDKQAAALSKSGIRAYNHNIDTSEAFYGNVITSRSFQERIDTLNTLIDNNVNICSGGIIGMGETADDRIAMLYTLASLKKQPFTVPLNVLVPIPGTPFENKKRIDDLEMVRTVATTRILMPQSNISLAAGRREMSEAAQALCFLAGVNSVFTGEKLLTTQNAAPDKDLEMFRKLGLKLI